MTMHALFWPPADELALDAEAIRAKLGAWPVNENRPAPACRICLTPPQDVQAGDIILAQAGAPAAGWLTQGACIITLSATQTVLRTPTGRFTLDGPRHDDWIAAFAAFIDCGFPSHDALCLALAWRAAAQQWPAVLADFPVPLDGACLPDAGLPPFPACPPDLGLYPVVPTAQWVERLIPLGVRTIQLRVKSASRSHRLAEIHAAVAAAQAVSQASGGRDEVRLFINDHWQEAIEAGAYGVHLGQEDMALADFSAIARAGLRLGLSTHGYYEILSAWRFRPSYIACGPIFATRTKDVAAPPQGLVRLAAWCQLLTPAVPVVAIGGISADRLSSVMDTGVRSAAVISAVTDANNFNAAVTALLGAFPS